jgi:hypothetical protein
MVVRAARNAASSTTPAISLAALSASHGSSSDGHAAMAMAMATCLPDEMANGWEVRKLYPRFLHRRTVGRAMGCASRATR